MPEQGVPTGPDRLPSPIDVLELLRDGSTAAASAFRHEFAAEIGYLSQEASVAFRGIRYFEKHAPASDRGSCVSAFLFFSVDSLLTSSHLLLRGLFPASRYAMRQYLEGFVMAALTSCSELDVYDRLVREGQRFSVSKAVARIKKKKTQKALGWSSELLESILEMHDDLSSYAHATLVSVTSPIPTHEFRRRAILGHFDPALIDRYQHELDVCLQCLVQHQGLMSECLDRLNSESRGCRDAPVINSSLKGL